MAEPLILVVSLWVNASQEEAFVANEREAARVMARYGGQIQRVLRVEVADTKVDPPFEIHIVRFPDEEAFQRYQSDPEVQRLSAGRSQVVQRTRVDRGRDVQVYHPSSSFSDEASDWNVRMEKVHPKVIDAAAEPDRMLNLARQEAERLGHPYVGTEHQLLALLCLGDPEVDSLLFSARVATGQVKEALEATLPKGGHLYQGLPSELPLTSRARKVLRFAEEARDLEDAPAIRPIHVLRGMFKEKLNIAAEILRQLGVSP